MRIINEKDKRFAANSLFPSFSYLALALMLGQVGTTRMHGSWGVHVFLGAPALVLLGLTFRRARLHWPAINAATPSPRSHALGWYLVLLAAGVCIGVLVSSGSVLVLGTGATLAYLLPWTRIPLCRSRFVVSSLALLAGAVAWVVVQGALVQSLYFVIAGWILCALPMFMHFLVLVSLDRRYRIGEPDLTDESRLNAYLQPPPVQERVSPDGRI